MFTSLLTSALLLASAVTASPLAARTINVTATDSAGLTIIDRLMLAPTQVDRIKLIANESDFVFDFRGKNLPANAFVTGLGGHNVNANRITFPPIIGNGAAITMGFLGPCGFNTPHVHPRAAEYNLVVEGTLIASVTAENGAPHMNHTVGQYMMTIFPAGALHTEYNPDCTNATFVAAFPNEDPGVGQMAQEFFGLEDNIVKASIGGSPIVNGANIDQFRSLIPANVALGVDSCLQKCGIAKRSL